MEVASFSAPTGRWTSSSEPSPPPRNLMDDSDSSITRKRPRLDSGDHSHRSMSADEPSGTPPPSKVPHPSTSPLRTTSGELRNGHEGVSTPVQTPSKVTINVRDPGHGFLQSPIAATHESLHASQQEAPSSTVLDGEGATGVDLSPDVISVSSSPVRSPEIEVAEIEDIDGYPGETRWRREGLDIQLSLLQHFPYHSSSRQAHETLRQIVKALESGGFEASIAFYVSIC